MSGKKLIFTLPESWRQRVGGGFMAKQAFRAWGESLAGDDVARSIR